MITPGDMNYVNVNCCISFVRFSHSVGVQRRKKRNTQNKIHKNQRSLLRAMALS